MKRARTRIKICGIREGLHAMVAADAGADAIGLVFYRESPRFVTPGTAANVVAVLPPFVATVGLQGFVTIWLQKVGIDLAGSTWLFEPTRGLVLVYTYFQIPLMLIVFTFTANAFLHHMIRNIVGSLVYVGSGKQEPGWIAELLAQRDRRNAAPTFSPDGLYLAAITYDPAFPLPAFPRHPLLDEIAP